MADETFRKKLRNGILLGFLGIALLAMVVTGFGTDGMGGLGGIGGQGAQTLAVVGDERITDADLSSLVDGEYRRAASQQPDLDRGQFVEQAFQPLLERMIGQAAIVDFAQRHGMVVPRDMVDRIIVGMAPFQNVAGQFDETAFRQALQTQNVTEQQLRDDIENGEIARMVLAPVGGQVRMPRAVATEYASLLLEQRQGAFGQVPTEAFAANINPSDQEIAQYYQRNQRSFAIPERRVIRYALLDRNSFGNRVAATDQEVAQQYQQNQAQYGPRQTRNLQRVILADENAARQFAQRVRGGTSFADAAQQAGFAAADINFPQQTQQAFTTLSSAEVATAVFAAQQGAVVGPVRTPLGFQVVRVDGISQTPGRALAEVRAEIVAAIEQRKLADALIASEERIQERLDNGESFEEVARAEGLTLQTTPAITRTGQAPGVNGPDGRPFQFPAELASVLQTGFEMEPDGDPLMEVIQPNARVAIIGLANVMPSAAPPLAQIRDQVRQRLIQQTALQRARQAADGIVQRLNSGMAPAQAYAQAGVPLPPTQSITRRRLELVRAGQAVPPPLTILFSIPQGRARILAGPQGSGWLIVHHQQRTAGTAATDSEGPALIAAMQQQLNQSGTLELQEQFARAI
ncbi:MAG TPA: peptidyl-prolyl cis-trans isomerase, partial [Allosphingosinicella sp.]